MSQNFKTGDRIRVKDRGHEGLIAGVSFNSIHQETEYYVIWDHFQKCGQVCYNASDVGDMWQQIGNLKDAIEADAVGKGYVDQDGELPKGNDIYRYKVQYTYEDKKECDHKWVEVGFNHSKIVCYHCDKEKT